MSNIIERINIVKGQLIIADKVRVATYNAMVNSIKEIVASNGGSIDMVDLYDEFDFIPIAVCYDGGFHPEYSSSMFSQLKSVFLDGNGILSFELEDEYDVCYDRILYCDMQSIFEELADWQKIVSDMTSDDMTCVSDKMAE